MPPQQQLPTLPAKKSSLPLFILILLFLAALVFGVWAFSSRQSIQKQANTKLATAQTTLQKAQAAQAKATADNESPYKTYTGNPTYGSLSFKYPKNWSAYIDETGSSQPLEAYFYPTQVPAITSNTAFALRVELVSDDYASVLSDFDSSVQSGAVRASAYLPPKLKGVANAQVGTRFDGAVNKDPSGNDQIGSLVILKVRDKTLEVYTESTAYLTEFNKVVLATLTYNP